jgi:hypothetical protein
MLVVCVASIFACFAAAALCYRYINAKQGISTKSKTSKHKNIIYTNVKMLFRRALKVTYERFLLNCQIIYTKGKVKGNYMFGTNLNGHFRAVY